MRGLHIRFRTQPSATSNSSRRQLRPRRTAKPSGGPASHHSPSSLRTTSGRCTTRLGRQGNHDRDRGLLRRATRWRTTCTSSTRRSVSSRCAARKASPAPPVCRRSASWRSNGSPATKPPPGKGTASGGQERLGSRGRARRRDVACDRPIANILLVHSNNAETLGVQGFPNMMKAENYVVSNHLAQVISQSFASAEEAFGSTQSLENLRYAFKNAAANGVTVLGSSGDGGTANGEEISRSARAATLFPFPTVEWPASDPLVTGVGGTYLCTDPIAARISRGLRTSTPASAPSAAARVQHGRTCARSPGRSRAVASATCSPGRRYQDTASGGQHPDPASTRGVPDIAFQASAAYRCARLPVACRPTATARTSTCIRPAGTTSAARRSVAPQWAGLVAIADSDQRRTASGLRSIRRSTSCR